MLSVETTAIWRSVIIVNDGGLSLRSVKSIQHRAMAPDVQRMHARGRIDDAEICMRSISSVMTSRAPAMSPRLATCVVCDCCRMPIRQLYSATVCSRGCSLYRATSHSSDVQSHSVRSRCISPDVQCFEWTRLDLSFPNKETDLLVLWSWLWSMFVSCERTHIGLIWERKELQRTSDDLFPDALYALYMSILSGRSEVAQLSWMWMYSDMTWKAENTNCCFLHFVMHICTIFFMCTIVKLQLSFVCNISHIWQFPYCTKDN